MGCLKIQGNKAACTSAISSLRQKWSSPCGTDHYLREFIRCCWLFHHSCSHKKTWDGRYCDWQTPWSGTAPAHIFKVMFGKLCPEAALACGWCGVYGAFPSVWYSFLKHLEENKPQCLQTSVVLFFFSYLGALNPFVFLLLKMKTELCNCTQLPVPAVLRSAQAKTWIASPSSPWRQSS